MTFLHPHYQASRSHHDLLTGHCSFLLLFPVCILSFYGLLWTQQPEWKHKPSHFTSSGFPSLRDKRQENFRRRKFPSLLCARFSPWDAPILSLGLCINLISVKPSLTNEKEVMRSISALVLPSLLYQFDFLPQHSLSCDILRNPSFTQVSSKILHLIFYSFS